MANIHGLVWLAIGAIVTAISGFMGPRLRFFFWVGIAMVIFGTFKLIVRYATGEEARLNPKAIPSDPKISRCTHCQASVYTSAQFCHMCGAKLSFQ